MEHCIIRASFGICLDKCFVALENIIDVVLEIIHHGKFAIKDLACFTRAEFCSQIISFFSLT